MPSLRLAGARIAAAALFALLTGLFAPGFAPGSALAQSVFDPFSVQAIDVDVTANSAQAAKDQAIAEAQRQGFAALLERLVAPEERGRVPRAEAAEYVRDFTVDQERSTANRYIAQLTVRYNGAAVRKFLQGAGIAVSEMRARPVVLVPVFVIDNDRPALWDDPNPWRAAWSALHGGGLVPLVMPLGDLGDIQAINTAQALSGDALAMQALGARWRSPDVLVVAANLRGKSLDVQLHAAPGAPKPFDTLTYRQNDGESQDAFLARVVKDIARAIDAVHRMGASAGAEAGSVPALVPLTGLAQWLAVRERLSRIPQVRRWELVSLSRTEAAVILHVAGDPATLADSLAKGGLTLTRADSFWTIAPQGVN